MALNLLHLLLFLCCVSIVCDGTPKEETCSENTPESVAALNARVGELKAEATRLNKAKNRTGALAALREMKVVKKQAEEIVKKQEEDRKKAKEVVANEMKLAKREVKRVLQCQVCVI